MKILIVNCVYTFGSTGKIVRDIANGLYNSNIDVTIAYGRGSAPVEQWPIIKLASDWVMKLQSMVSKISGYSYDCSPFSTHNLFRLIEKIKPDVVNLHCVNSNTINLAKTITYLKQHHIKTVISIHAEFLFTGGCGYSYECNKWLTGCKSCPQFHRKGSQLPKSCFFDCTHYEWKALSKAYNDFEELVVTCVSPWLANRVRQSPFFIGRKIVPLINGLDVDVFKNRDASRLRKNLNLEGKKIILHVTPNFYSPIKGGNYVLKIAKMLEAEYPDAKLIICGYRGDGKDLPSNVIAVSFTRDQLELAEYYSLADVTLLTSKRETFSMVTAESLCCGTPLVGFKAGGPESIALPESSIFCEYGDVKTLYQKVVDVLSGVMPMVVDIKQARLKYSKETMKDAYRKVYEDIVNNRGRVE